MERVMEDVVKVVVAKVGPAAKMRPRMLVRMAHPEERVEGGLILDPESITAFVMKERNLPKRQRGECWKKVYLRHTNNRSKRSICVFEIPIYLINLRGRPLRSRMFFSGYVPKNPGRRDLGGSRKWITQEAKKCSAMETAPVRQPIGK